MRLSAARSFVALLVAPVAVHAGEDATPANLITNGEFRRAPDGDVEGWNVDLGAGKPLAYPPRRESLEGGGLALEGDALVVHWRLFRQPIAVRPGASYSLTFEQRAVGSNHVRRLAGEAGQRARELAQRVRGGPRGT